MILAEKQTIRTPIEDMLLREMSDDDTKFIVSDDEYSDAVDDLIDTEPGLFDNEDDIDIPVNDSLDNEDLFD